MHTSSSELEELYIPNLPTMARTPNEELLEAQTHVWNHQFSFINSFSLNCAVQLGIPDIIHKHGKPTTLSHLIDALSINKEKAGGFARLMRVLVNSGFFTTSEEGGYMLTPPSRLLLKDETVSAAPYLLLMFDHIFFQPWHVLSEWFQNDHPTPFEAVHGRKLWDYASQDPKLNDLFNESMARDARLVSSVLIGDCPEMFQGINSLVDVGGGTGAFAKAIAEKYQHLQCVVLDLPHVVDGLQGSHNLRFVGGNMFDHIPPSHAIIIKWTLHNWNDEQSIKILKNCKEAIPSKDKGGKLIIIEIIIGDDDQNEDHKSNETQLFFDMLMVAIYSTGQRNKKEWEKLFFDSGFTGYKIIYNLGIRSVIEVFYHT